MEADDDDLVLLPDLVQSGLVLELDRGGANLRLHVLDDAVRLPRAVILLQKYIRCKAIRFEYFFSKKYIRFKFKFKLSNKKL